MSPRKRKVAPPSAMATDLLDRLRSFRTAPVLFVGSGVSLRYLGIPTWNGLLEDLADKTSQPYGYYYSSASGDLPHVASLLATPLHDLLWSSAGEATRLLYPDDLLRSDSAVKIYVCELLRDAVNNLPKHGDLAAEIKLFRDATVDAIITTNYDLLLEDLFPAFEVFVGQDDVVFSDPQGVGEIYKIHGSIQRPNSLVLTTSDYDRFTQRNAYLTAKLLTMFAEHPVIFLGYGVNDPNVQQMVTSLAQCLTKDHLHRLQDRLIVVSYVKDAKPQTAKAFINTPTYNIPVLQLTVPDFKEVLMVLGQVDRKFPAAMLRRLKEHVFELVRDNDPAERLGVVDIDDNTLVRDLDVVFGVGAIAALGQQGYVGLSRLDLLCDLLHDDRKWDPDRVVKQSLPQQLSRAGNFPYMKYLKAGGFLDAAGALIRESELDPRFVARIRLGTAPFLPTPSQRKHADARAAVAGDFATLAKDPNVADVLTCLGALPFDQVPVDDLRAYLITVESGQVHGDKVTTGFAKAVCLLDALEYGPSPAW